jgi:hypothetical protein
LRALFLISSASVTHQFAAALPSRTAHFASPWLGADQLFGNVVVVFFVLVQYLDGLYTYAGFAIWGLGIEANPLIRSAAALVGPGIGLFLAKLTAIGFGILLHLRGVHNVVAALTALYLILSIVPWTALLLLN